MSQFFVYITTQTSADPYIPVTTDLRLLARDVSDAFVAISGGVQKVGQLTLYPVQRAVPNSLLCDGKEVPKTAFPELYEFLGDSQGTATNSANFVLPNYLEDFAPAPVAEPETVVGGSVTTPAIPGNYSRASSGGRTERLFQEEV